jgi:hypothetical protein
MRNGFGFAAEPSLIAHPSHQRGFQRHPVCGREHSGPISRDREIGQSLRLRYKVLAAK